MPDRIIDWLLNEGPKAEGIDTLLPDFAERLHELGVEVGRIWFTKSFVHPLAWAQGVTWLRGQEEVAPAGGDDGRDACPRALAAAREIQARIAVTNERRAQAGEEPARIGVALHYGDVSYGNIGAKHRLDFTVIGAAVNRTARLESLGSKLGVGLALSTEFAKRCGEPTERVAEADAKGVGTMEIWRIAR